MSLKTINLSIVGSLPVICFLNKATGIKDAWVCEDYNVFAEKKAILEGMDHIEILYTTDAHVACKKGN